MENSSSRAFQLPGYDLDALVLIASNATDVSVDPTVF